MIEQELLELSFPTLGLASSMRAADAEMHQLHDKVAALEVELHGERRRHQEVVAKLEDHLSSWKTVEGTRVAGAD